MFAAFPIGLFLIGAVVLVALPVGFSLQPYFRNRGRLTFVCPENHEPVTVELDNKFAFKTALRGEEHERLESCSRWPEKGECGQECLAQSICHRKTSSAFCRSGTSARIAPSATVP
jgi:hypothetical protein